MAAQERTIIALEEINRLKDAYNASERARFRAVQAGSAALALLGEARAEVAQLNRKIDSIEYTASRPAQDEQLSWLHERLRKAEAQESELRIQLERAERDRDKYQQIADFAARRLAFLESELHVTGTSHNSTAGHRLSELNSLNDFRTDGRTPNQIDEAINKLNDYLNQQEHVTEDAASTIGWSPSFIAEGGRVSEASASQKEAAAQHESAARVLSLAQQTSDQAIAEARSEANRIVTEARKRAAELLEGE